MAEFTVIGENILYLACLMAVGFIAVKSGYISEDVKNTLSAIVVKLTMPLLVLNALTKNELTAAKLLNSVAVILVAFFAIGILYLIGTLSARLLKLPHGTAVIHRSMTAFGNIVFLGYPLISALYGSEGLFYAAIYAMVNDLFVWTLVVCQLSSVGSSERMSPLQTAKKLLNPATIAFFISFIMMLSGLKFTGLAYSVTNGLGSTTTPLSMLFIGATLAGVKFNDIKRIGTIFIIVLVKMLLVPILLIFILKNLPVSPMVASVAIMQVGVPSQTILSVLTREYGGDSEYTSQGIFVTTLAGLITMPVIYYLISNII